MSKEIIKQTVEQKLLTKALKENNIDEALRVEFNWGFVVALSLFKSDTDLEEIEKVSHAYSMDEVNIQMIIDMIEDIHKN